MRGPHFLCTATPRRNGRQLTPPSPSGSDLAPSCPPQIALRCTRRSLRMSGINTGTSMTSWSF